jgi:lipid II:glycine glycyltransferase (peptidoglycan interpeptide bridge formation enzyme)
MSRYDWKLFQDMFARQSDHIHLWLTTTGDGRVAAGALVFYARTHSVYWHGAAQEDLFALRPMNLLFSEIIRDACEGGYRWFDFGPSAGIEGVRKFKESFGAKFLDCSYVQVEQPAPAALPADR